MTGLGIAAVVVLPLLVAVALAGSRLASLGHERGLAVAAVRAVVQLAAVGLVVGAALQSVAGALAFVLLMLAVATFTSTYRIRSAVAVPRLLPRCAIAVCLPALLVLGLVVLPAVVPRNPATLLPLGGIIAGGTMNATTLAGRRLLVELRSRYGEYEAGLSLGFTAPASFRLVAGPSAADALLPTLDQTRTVGLVTLPGAFVGMVLGGASPVQAAALQLVVLLALLAAGSLSILAITELLAHARL